MELEDAEKIVRFVLERFSSVIVEDDVERIALNLKAYLDTHPFKKSDKNGEK